MIKKLKKAFTITELVIVIAVIAILAAVLIPTFSNVIENANQSAAMQTCRTALTNYLSTVQADDDPDNDDVTGIVFTSGGYAYVYVSSQLHLIDELDNLASYTVAGTDGSYNLTAKGDAGSHFDVEGVPSSSLTTGITFETTVDSREISTTLHFAATESAEGNDEGLVTGTADEEGKIKQAETVYMYSISINNTDYCGFFTMEGSNAKYQTEGATYSRIAGFNQVPAQADTAVYTVTAS